MIIVVVAGALLWACVIWHVGECAGALTTGLARAHAAGRGLVAA